MTTRTFGSGVKRREDPRHDDRGGDVADGVERPRSDVPDGDLHPGVIAAPDQHERGQKDEGGRAGRPF